MDNRLGNYRLRMYYRSNVLKKRLCNKNLSLLEQVKIAKSILDIKRDIDPVIPKIRRHGSSMPALASYPLTGYDGGHRGKGFILY